MSEFVYYAAISLDGFIAKPDGDVGWLNKYLETGEDYGFDQFMQSIQAIVMGRETYEKCLEFGQWPYGDIPCWVFSTKMETGKLDGLPSVQVTDASPDEFVKTLSAEGISRVWILGGAKLATTFLQKGLIHEFDLAIMPEILGQGIPLLQPLAAHAELDLLKHVIHPSGVVQLGYRLKTRVPIGDSLKV